MFRRYFIDGLPFFVLLGREFLRRRARASLRNALPSQWLPRYSASQRSKRPCSRHTLTMADTPPFTSGALPTMTMRFIQAPMRDLRAGDARKGRAAISRASMPKKAMSSMK